MKLPIHRLVIGKIHHLLADTLLTGATGTRPGLVEWGKRGNVKPTYASTSGHFTVKIDNTLMVHKRE